MSWTINHRNIFKKGWMAVAFIVALIATHGLAFYHALSRTAWTVAGGLAVVVLLTHFGVIGSIYVFLRRRFWQ